VSVSGFVGKGQMSATNGATSAEIGALEVAPGSPSALPGATKCTTGRSGLRKGCALLAAIAIRAAARTRAVNSEQGGQRREAEILPHPAAAPRLRPGSGLGPEGRGAEGPRKKSSVDGPPRAFAKSQTHPPTIRLFFS
jgi:hypothetical protein